MMNAETWNFLVRELYEHHLFGSADTLIEKAQVDRGKLLEMIQMTHEARKHAGHQLLPGVYFLVTCPPGSGPENDLREIGLVLPLRVGPSLGKEDPFRLDDAARTAIDQARAAVKAYFQTPGLPKLFCRFPDFFSQGDLNGPSLGLAVALAFVQAYSRCPFPGPVLVTGEITENMAVHRVEQTELKVQAAWKELHGGEGLILMAKMAQSLKPREEKAGRLVQVSSLREAVQAIWGQNVAVHQEFVDLERFLEEIRKNATFRENIPRIHELLQLEQPPMDRLFLTCELMIQHRHLGEMEIASGYQRELEEAMCREHDSLDALACQEMEVQILATELDLFPGPEFRDKCEEMLTRQSDMHNRIRVRGLLAKFESMNGHSERSIALRKENLKSHENRSSLRSEKPFTLCHLVWECARANEAALFDTYANELAILSPTEDFKQWSYNHHALVAGSGLLGRYQPVWEFLHTPGQLFWGAGALLREFFHSDQPVKTHPEISTLRALIRLCRKLGRLDEALRLGRRFHVEVKAGDLTQWLFVVGRLERALAWCEHDGSGVEDIRAAVPQLRACHQPATAFYPALVAACEAFEFTPDAVARLELELDKLYY